MQLRFLGTGAGDYYEFHQQNCKEDNCARAVELGGRNIRHASSLLIDNSILIDHNRQNDELKNIKTLFITHGHYDHFQPENILKLSNELDVYGNQTVINALKFARANVFDEVSANFISRSEDDIKLNLHRILPYESVLINDTKITAVHANHMIDKENMILEQTALNYIIEKNGKTVLYALDSSVFLTKTRKFLTNFKFDALILDATFGYRQVDLKLSGHMNFDIVEKTVEDLKKSRLMTDNCQVILSHISCHHVAPHDEIVEDLSSRGLTLAYDRMEIEI